MEPKLRRDTEDQLTVLKLGGSVITEKDKPMTANLEAMERLAKEISRADAVPLVIVHGGGSFGHTIAKKYNIKELARTAEILAKPMIFTRKPEPTLTIIDQNTIYKHTPQ